MCVNALHHTRMHIILMKMKDFSSIKIKKKKEKGGKKYALGCIKKV